MAVSLLKNITDGGTVGAFASGEAGSNSNFRQNSGVPDDKVIELHGNATYAKCLDCGQVYEFAPLKVAFQKNGEVPDCEHCGGMIKTATISFGQPMPEREMLLAEQATIDCDLFIAIGSSLLVYPAASFPLRAKQYGAKLVILNREPTEMDRYADIVIHDEIGPVLSQTVSELKLSKDKLMLNLPQCDRL